MATIRRQDNRQTIVKKAVQTADGAVINCTYRAAAGAENGKIILIHALAMDHSFWTEVIQSLPADYSIAAVDVRGHGASTNGSRPLDRLSVVADIVSVLDDLGWSAATLAGCSMGGCIALATAADHIERVNGLVLIDTTASYGEDSAAAWASRADKAEKEGFEALIDFQRERWFSPEFIAERPDIFERCTAVFLHNTIQTYTQACAFLAGIDLRPALERIHIPVSILVGSDDHATPASMAETLNKGLRRSTLAILAGKRHFTPLEAPESVAAAIEDIANQAVGRTARDNPGVV